MLVLALTATLLASAGVLLLLVAAR
jgi:hypothetical protein